MILTVDTRNTPAWRLYQQAGFIGYAEQRLLAWEKHIAYRFKPMMKHENFLYSKGNIKPAFLIFLLYCERGIEGCFFYSWEETL